MPQKTEEFGGLAPQVQHETIRNLMMRVLEEEEIADAVLRAITPKLAAINQRLDALDKTVASLGTPGSVLPLPPRPPAPTEDPAYRQLRWTQGLVPTATGKPIAPGDTVIPEKTQDTWHTNPTE